MEVKIKGHNISILDSYGRYLQGNILNLILNRIEWQIKVNHATKAWRGKETLEYRVQTS